MEVSALQRPRVPPALVAALVAALRAQGLSPEAANLIGLLLTIALEGQRGGPFV